MLLPNQWVKESQVIRNNLYTIYSAIWSECHVSGECSQDVDFANLGLFGESQNLFERDFWYFNIPRARNGCNGTQNSAALFLLKKIRSNWPLFGLSALSAFNFRPAFGQPFACVPLRHCRASFSPFYVDTNFVRDFIIFLGVSRLRLYI